ncbi:hypothetical protein WME75_20965 [Sorangium sp. So ce1014]|uniref:hypothetical protein n=1 Tax=Sorangium sp. So ce1014 TaxID=3133326 RepID=UPI003F607764
MASFVGGCNGNGSGSAGVATHAPPLRRKTRNVNVSELAARHFTLRASVPPPAARSA